MSAHLREAWGKLATKTASNWARDRWGDRGVYHGGNDSILDDGLDQSRIDQEAFYVTRDPATAVEYARMGKGLLMGPLTGRGGKASSLVAMVDGEWNRSEVLRAARGAGLDWVEFDGTAEIAVLTRSGVDLVEVVSPMEWYVRGSKMASTWRGFTKGDEPFWKQHDFTIATQFRGRERYYEAWVLGETFRNFPKLDEAKAAIEAEVGSLTWHRVTLPLQDVLHYYFGWTTEFSDPLTIYVADLW